MLPDLCGHVTKRQFHARIGDYFMKTDMKNYNQVGKVLTNGKSRVKISTIESYPGFSVPGRAAPTDSAARKDNHHARFRGEVI